MVYRQTCKQRIYVGISIVIGCCIWSSAANGFVSDDGPLIANFIYNMTNTASWGATHTINICSYGHDEVSEALRHLFNKDGEQNKNLDGAKDLAFVDRVELAQLYQCQVLYISRFEEKLVPTLLEHAQNLPMLTASTIDNFMDMGGMMELKESRQKLRLGLDKVALKKTGIQLSPIILMSIKPEE